MPESAMDEHWATKVAIFAVAAQSTQTRALQTSPLSGFGVWLGSRLRAPWRWLQSWMTASGSAAQDLSDTEIMARLKGTRGQRRAKLYETLVKRHQAWLVRMLVCLVGSRADAEDVAQEVFVRALMAMDSFRGDASFKTWLRTIATRTAYNWQRDKRTARNYEQRAFEDKGAEWESTPASYSGALLARDALGKLLQKLSYPYREILILRYVEEMSVADIASALDLGQSAVKMRLKRAREQMEILYQEIDNA